MLYGHKEIVDNRVATLVTSATTIEEYESFLVVVREQAADKRNYNEMYTSKAVQHMVEDVYRGFRKPVYVFYHQSEVNPADDKAREEASAQRDAFVKEWNIELVENGVVSRDKQSDMLFEKKLRDENAAKVQRDLAQQMAEDAGVPYNGEREQTLAEMFNLEENDPWDRRTEEEKEVDREMQRQMRKMKEEGTMSDDSFAAPVDKSKANPDVRDPNAPNGQLTINDTDGIINADGTLDISKIMATKTGGPIDENLKKAKQDAFEAKKKELLGDKTTFSPEDFAAVLAGDGSADSINHKGDRATNHGAPVDRSSLSDAANAARDDLRSAEEQAMEQTRRENDFKAKQERDAGTFRGADLFGEDDHDWADVDAELQTELQNLGLQSSTVSMKEYPFNSMIGDKSILPFDHFGSYPSSAGESITAIVGHVNVTVHGTMNMGDTAAAIVGRTDDQKPGYVIYQRTGGRLGQTVVTSVVKVR